MRKKGFTLIELLAVIVILAVIALITIPMILGVIEKSRKAAFKDSVYGIIESADLYIASNLGVPDGEFVCNGKKCYKEEQKLNFKGEVPISGTVLIENNKVSVSFLSNGKYCANGTREELKISDDCISLDETEAEVNEELISYTSTTNIINIILPNDFAIDKESGIKEYQVTLNGETKVIEYDGIDKIVTFNELKQATEYEAKIKVINNNDIEKEVILLTKTLEFNNPSITLTNTPETAVNGYLKSQVANIEYDKTNIENPTYYVKTTREGVSSIEVTKSCGTGTTPGECSDIESTTTLAANTWYQVSGNLDVTYDQLATEEATIYALTYDGVNYSGTVTATISKITKEVSYTVNHYQMNVSGSGYTLKETETLKSYVYFEITPSVKSYGGFSSPTTKTITLADGSNVVNYYYSRNRYTVTVNRGTGIASVSGAGTYYYGASVTVGYTLSTGYNFSRWSGTYTASSFTMPASNVSMTANGVAKTFTITFNANGGSVSTTSKTVTYASTYGTLPTPSRSSQAMDNLGMGTSLQTGVNATIYYTFLGWYTAASGGTQVTSSSTVSITGNQTLYAHWGAYAPSGNVWFGVEGLNATSSAVVTVYNYGYNYITLTLNGSNATPYLNGSAVAWSTRYYIGGSSSVTIQAISSVTNTRAMYWTLSN